jgi:hypothetical protein
MIRKTKAVHPVGYSMDKAYDSGKIRRVMEEVQAACMIPVRKRARSSVYRRTAPEEFDEERYHPRNVVETVFSVEKRVFADVNHSRRDRLRNKESTLRNVCYNLYRYCNMVVVMVVKSFYRTVLCNKAFWVFRTT